MPTEAEHNNSQHSLRDWWLLRYYREPCRLHRPDRDGDLGPRQHARRHHRHLRWNTSATSRVALGGGLTSLAQRGYMAHRWNHMSRGLLR